MVPWVLWNVTRWPSTSSPMAGVAHCARGGADGVKVSEQLVPYALGALLWTGFALSL